MCLYYNDKQMHSNDFTRDSAYMSIACYGEISSGMFVLFLPVLPRFFTHLKEVSSLSSSVHRRAPSALEFSDVGPAGGPNPPKADPRDRDRKQSLWHISYTQRTSEDRRPIVSSSKAEDFEGKSLGSKSQASSLSRSP